MVGDEPPRRRLGFAYGLTVGLLIAVIGALTTFLIVDDRSTDGAPVRGTPTASTTPSESPSPTASPTAERIPPELSGTFRA